MHQGSKHFIGSVNVDALSINIPLDKIIKICTNLYYNNEDVLEGINKSEFKNVLSLATQDSHFILNDVLYKQKDGVVVVYLLEHTIGNVFC